MSEQAPKDLILHRSERSYPELEPEKETLAIAIAKGMSFAKAGALVGWSRQRVRYTFHNDLAFRSAIETEKEKLQKELQDRIADQPQKYRRRSRRAGLDGHQTGRRKNGFSLPQRSGHFTK